MSGPGHHLVAVAGSAGGVEALKTFTSALPGDLPATVLVALHLPATGRSHLAEILRRRCALDVVPAQDGLELVPGRLVVAHADSHLLVADDRIALGRGARENGNRPSHDAMLRAAALARGPRAVGVVLTGLLDDGAAGLRTVARYGGSCLVQDPDDAEFAPMPRAALAAVPDAVTADVPTLAKEVVRVVGEVPGAQPAVDDVQRRRDVAELASALGRRPLDDDGGPLGDPSPYACPDCHGVLNVVPDDAVVRFRCRTGHAWTGESLAAQHDVEVEAALWTALRVLEERTEISRRLAERARAGGRGWSDEHFRARADEAEHSARLLRELLRR
ncbi:MAG: chemotaxis protein CheB, partial [Actinomycetes bacterium]